MRNPLCLLILGLFLLTGCAGAPRPTQVPYDRTWPEWNKVLARFAQEDGVDYAGLTANRKLLDTALESFGAVRPETYRSWIEDDRLAYLINVHNAYAIKRIVDDWPVKSMAATRLIGSPLGARDIAVLERRWSLRELQDEIMSDTFNDSRAIFLINWGERGCAPLPPLAVTGLNLSDLLDRQARRVLADPQYVEYDEREMKIYVTPLLEMYEDEILQEFTTYWIFLGRYLPADQSKILKKHPPRIRWLAWDDSLNVVQPR